MPGWLSYLPAFSNDPAEALLLMLELVALCRVWRGADAGSQLPEVDMPKVKDRLEVAIHKTPSLLSFSVLPPCVSTHIVMA